MTGLFVWIHLTAAVLWIGGMLFLSLTVVPVLQQGTFAPHRGPFFKAMALRFRRFVWLCILLLLVTGPPLLSRHVASLLDPTTWPPIVYAKLGLVSLLLLLTAVHDLILGPAVGRLHTVPEQARTDRDRLLVRSARWVPRISLLLALVILYAAAALART
ncbi:MAG: CopD family protein [Nitrospirota bacterium]|nr:CopD family protein [Nitrospirota bacterium]MDE3225582.1 CopD family protein [Nitrospirota bacterium]MDE3243002.1 CopD family protein [Nitrospirota bacterium]